MASANRSVEFIEKKEIAKIQKELPSRCIYTTVGSF